VSWIFGLVAVAAVGLVIWDAFFRGRRGIPLLWSIIAMLILTATGIARGAGATGPWPLAGLIIGGVLFVIAERAGGSASTEPAP
jgi:hypothetical protein